MEAEIIGIEPKPQPTPAEQQQQRAIACERALCQSRIESAQNQTMAAQMRLVMLDQEQAALDASIAARGRVDAAA